jgi:D-lyxose ketol-isomerase
MKRSEINAEIKYAMRVFEKHHLYLPDFCHWTPKDWAGKGTEAEEIRLNQLGWDITDFGQGSFFQTGLLLITLRNGNTKQPEQYPKPYAEKIMIVREEQVTPMHFHWNKMEDIINRGGGNLIIKLYQSTPNEELSESEVLISVDGIRKSFPAGYELRLLPGQSVTLPPRLYHRFWGEPGSGTVLVGEVSMCNDDEQDNRFYDAIGRFPAIEEDELPFRLLCNEYNRY